MAITHSIRPDRPVDALTVSLLREVDCVARALGINYFVGGATARVVVLEHVFGAAPGRATLDVDIGICVADWAMHDLFKQRLTSTGRFTAVPDNPHKLIYRANAAAWMQLDIIPFGEIEAPAASIAWLPDMNPVMNVAGFGEAADAAVLVEIEPDLPIPFASLPAMAMLKLLAWRDRHHESRRDATDLLMLLRTYAGAGNEDRLYENEGGLLERHGFDLEIAAAALLARDASVIVSVEARAQIEAVLGDEALYRLLLDHMAFGDRQAMRDAGFDPVRVRQRMDAFRQAFMQRFRAADPAFHRAVR